MEKLR